MNKLKAYAYNALIALDQFGNALTGGDPDETISSRCAKRRTEPGWSILAAFLEWVRPGHLDRAEASDADEGKDAVLTY